MATTFEYRIMSLQWSYSNCFVNIYQRKIVVKEQCSKTGIKSDPQDLPGPRNQMLALRASTERILSGEVKSYRDSS